MKKLAFALVLALGFLAEKGWSQLDFRKKIHPALAQKLAVGPAQMLVHFAAQADLAEAATIADWDERGRWAYGQLTAVADATQGNALAVCRAFGAEPQPFWISNFVFVEGNLALAEALAALPEVAAVQPNRQFFMPDPLEQEVFRPETAGDRIPTTATWGVSKIQADQVWSAGYRGAGIVVAGADTGIKWDHIGIKRSYRGWNGSTASHDYNWRDAIQTASSVPLSPAGNVCGFNSLVPCDDNSHGTHTIGTMTGYDTTIATNGFFGVAPDAKWIGCRNMDDGWGTEVTYAECFQFFFAPTKTDRTDPQVSQRPHVVNNSWGFPVSEGYNPNDPLSHDAIFNALNALHVVGTVMVVSAGNSGSGCNTINTPPAIYPNAFVVGASNSSDGIAGFSSRGYTATNPAIQKPDIVAPGVGVISCTNASTTSYGSSQGTSMAGPHVAGAAALFLNIHPSFLGNAAGVQTQLRSNATNLGSVGAQTCNGVSPPTIPNPVWGWGRLNAFELITLPVELLFFRANAKGETVRLDWATASEIGADHFLIEKSRDGEKGWQLVQKAAAAGDSQTEKSYQLVDNQPFTGRNFYRLTQIDRDGTARQSALATVDFSKKAAIRAYPNPVGDELTLALFAEKSADAELSVFDANGRLALRLPMPVVRGSMTCRVAVGDLPAGVYFLRLTDPAGRELLGEGSMVKN